MKYRCLISTPTFPLCRESLIFLTCFTTVTFQASIKYTLSFLLPSVLAHQTVMPKTPSKTTAATTNQSPQDSESTTYTASCHCRALIYTITTTTPLSSPSARISQCNCSICVRNGYLMIYPSASSLTFLKGSMEELKVRLPILTFTQSSHLHGKLKEIC